jgi:hypothetical protein
MAASGEISWPPAGTLLAVYGEILMAADNGVKKPPVDVEIA